MSDDVNPLAKQPQSWPLKFICVAVGICTLIMGYVFGVSQSRIVQTLAEERGQEAHLQQGYAYTNPLLSCEVAQEATFQELFPFKSHVEEVIQQAKDRGDVSLASVYFRDLNDGPWFGINETESFYPASLLKLPIMMGMFKKAEADSSFLEKKLPYDEKTASLTEDIQAQPLQTGKEYTMLQLLEQMMIHSDNAVANMLVQADTPAVLSVYKDLGVKLNVDSNPSDPQLTVRQYSSFFRILFNSSYLSRALSERALEILTRTSFTNGLVAGVPKEVKVAHKYGERTWSDSESKQLHDCGIVYYPKKPYLLCVMTRGTDFEKQSKLISAISSTVFQSVNQQIGEQTRQ